MAMNEIIILASGSPRRRELLTQIGIPFKVIPALSEERTQSCDPEEICRSLATVKAEEVAKRIMDARAVYNAQETEICRDSCDGETAEGSSLYGEIPTGGRLFPESTDHRCGYDRCPSTGDPWKTEGCRGCCTDAHGAFRLCA